MSNLAKVREKVQSILTSNLGQIQLGKEGDFRIEYESTMVTVSVSESGDWTFVSIMSPIAVNSQPSVDVFEWCNFVNMTMEFGKVIHSFDPDSEGKKNMTIVKHVLLGNTLDPDELLQSLVSVVSAANELDEIFVERFGGSRYIDS